MILKKFLLATLMGIVAFHAGAKAEWITAANAKSDQPNTWIAYRHDFKMSSMPRQAVATIAADSKYWLWINGELAVFEGSLKRGPSPTGTYYDTVNLLPYLRKGVNRIALLQWYFGKDGFSHMSSGQPAIFFDMKLPGNQSVESGKDWLSCLHPAYATASGAEPNYRLPESNILFDARKNLPADWKKASDLPMFKKSRTVSEKPFGELVERPIPQWKDFGIEEATVTRTVTDTAIIYTASLPYNMQMTPILDITDPTGGTLIDITTDHTLAGSAVNLRAQYITAPGQQIYESLGWLNGQKVILSHAPDKDVTINSIRYRQTGYDTTPEGRFTCDDEFIMRFWDKALRTIYVNMRDTYFDCPDRERAQWWGDVTVLTGESFYTLSPSHALLTRKGIHELVNWQRPDSTLFSPVPGNYNHELPAQMLASIGHYGFWNYYMNSADSATLAHAYPGVKKYLAVWTLDDTGLTNFRPGEWSWGDWGDNIDIRLLLAAWHYLALKGASAMAVELGMPQDTVAYSTTMKSIATAFNRCWTGTAYRHPQYHKDTDDRVQAMAVLTGIAGPDKYEALKAILHRKEHASPYMEKYVMEALFALGDGRYAIDRMKRRFATMVNDPDCTTLFEGWEEGTYGGGSTNHAWSGGAITVIAQDACGLRPTAPGWREFTIKPDFDIFGSCAIEVPTVIGTIKSSYKHTNTGISMQIEVPEGSTARLILPSDEQVLSAGSHSINI